MIYPNVHVLNDIISYHVTLIFKHMQREQDVALEIHLNGLKIHSMIFMWRKKMYRVTFYRYKSLEISRCGPGCVFVWQNVYICVTYIYSPFVHGYMCRMSTSTQLQDQNRRRKSSLVRFMEANVYSRYIYLYSCTPVRDTDFGIINHIALVCCFSFESTFTKTIYDK